MEMPADSRSDLEHLLMLAGCYDLQPRNMLADTVCRKHRDWLLHLSRRKHNCHLCVDVFQKKRRSTTSLRRVVKCVALHVWHHHRLNL